MSLIFKKRRQLMGAAALLGGLPLSARAVESGTLRLVTSHLPPLSIESGGLRPGGLLELVEELCTRVRLTPNLDFVPWKRAIFMATTMPHTAIFPLTRLSDREAKFRWLAPLYEENYIFLTPKGSSFDVQRPAQMKNKRIALIRGAAQTSLLKELGYPRMVEARSVDEVHRFMVEGMADAAIGERGIIRNALRTRKVEQDFLLSEPVRKTVAWLAGSLDFTAADAAMFQKAMKEMVADGTSTRILRKYDLA